MSSASGIEHETPAETEARKAREADLEQRKSAEIVQDAQLLQVGAQGQVSCKEAKDKAWKELCKALQVDPTSLKKLNKQRRRRGLVNLAYLAVILGCELDLYGFGMAVSGYWELNYITKIMCILMPVGYVVAALMYMFYANDIQEREENRRRMEEREAEPKVQNKYLPTARSSTTTVQQPMPPPNTKQPITMQYYHFLPVFRFYLVVKDKEVDDIEALFRVNSLSSFSLGFAQIVGIIFSGLETDWDLDLFTWINVCSQIINWTITLMYFMTEVSAKMGAAMKVDALIYNSEKRLKRKWELYLQCVNQSSENSSTDSTEALFSFERNIDREIQLLANVKETDLTPFIMKDKFEALKFLHRHMNNIYANI